MKNFKEIEISVEDRNLYEWLLSRDEIEGYPEDAAIRTFTTKFDNGFEADIKICSGTDNFFIDPVLFDKDGNQVALLDPEGELVGLYTFEVEDEKYYVDIYVPGDIYFCDNCGDMVDLSKEYSHYGDIITCHTCNQI